MYGKTSERGCNPAPNGMTQSAERTLARKSTKTIHYTRVRFSVVRGPDRGQEFITAASSFKIGTAPENDLVLNDNTVSRFHCEIFVEEQHLRLRDLNSTNGVLLGSTRIYDAQISPPAKIQLGETLLSIQALPSTVERERATYQQFGDLLGASPRMQELFADLERIAPHDISLLIEGETGSGKELVAESVHRNSHRAHRPFLVFDCSAVAPQLVESDLFGHERGAFTGAIQSRAGVFELAQGGTVFLDELGELPLDLQPKLLRVLEKREVRRVGGSTAFPIDVRLVSATHRKLTHEIQAGRFRQDLYFRLAAAHVKVPPLRERLDDLPLLVDHLLQQMHSSLSHESLPEATWQMLLTHRWPGNVRELKNVLQRFLITPERSLPLSSDSAPPPPSPSPVQLLPLREARRQASDAFEREYLKQLLAQTGGNVSRAASLAEVSRQMIQKLMRQHGY